MELNDHKFGPHRVTGNRGTRFRQADIARAVKGAKAAGLSVSKIEIDPNGSIVITSGVPDGHPPGDEYMAWERGGRAN
jgi:hypothetical protein